MNKKKLFDIIGDHNVSLQERMFRLIALIGMAGLAIGIIVGIFSGESKANIIPLVCALFVLVCIVFISIRYGKIQFGAVVTATIIICAVLPYNFLTSGGIYGGAPIWFVFGVVYISIVVEGKMKYVFLTGSLLVLAACYYIACFYPEFIIHHTTEMAFVDSFTTLMIVSVLICSMVLLQIQIYRSENAIAQKQKKEIEELNKTQSRFFSNMSHEIRTPINTIIGLNEMILREAVSDEVASDAKSIQGASNILLTLINDILDLSKIESGKMDIVPAPYDLSSMLSDIVNMIWIRAKQKGLEFHIDVDQTMPSQLLGDEIRIKQVLINVLNNAVKYTSEGAITLSIQCMKREKDSVLISYTINDTGIGIKKENIPYLFSAFKRVDEKKNRYIEGTGLGLSIVKQLVDLMGGDIAVNSIYTKGSSFVITLPQEVIGDTKIGKLDLEERHELNVREHYKQSFEAPKARVLIVDDNETNLMVAQKLLRDTKVKTDIAGSGEECLKKTLQNHYDVIFMDHLMPAMDGIECLHRIRTQTGGLNQDIPVVILTANAGGENQELYRREGFDGYLLKPVSGIQLETELLRHLPKDMISVLNTENFSDTVSAPVLADKRKRSVMISTDSVCDLPDYLIEKYQISVQPYRVVTEGGEFLDGVETESDGVLSYISRHGKDVCSNAPKTEDYEEFFADMLTKAQTIIHITMAKNVSAGYSNAVEASNSFDNVIVIDSGHLSSGMGFVVLCAAKAALDGQSAEAIVREIEHIRTRVRTSFIVDSTEYLANSGRISSKVNVLCKSFMLHPVLELKRNSMVVDRILVGTRDYARKKYIASILRAMWRADKKFLFITYAGLTGKELNEIEEQIKKRYGFEEIIYQKASPAISINCGPGSFGLLFVLEDNFNNFT